MRVLMLTQYYHPEPHDQFTSLAKKLVELGHEVQVLTGFPCYPRGRTYDGWRQQLYKEAVEDGVSVVRLPQVPDHSRNALRRAWYYLSFALSAATIGLWRSRPADVVLVYQAALPVGLAGWLISLWRRAPLILNVVDLWPESVAASGMLRSRAALWLIEQVVSFTYARARRICVITEGYRDRLVSRGVPAGKIAVVRMWGREDGAQGRREFQEAEWPAGVTADSFVVLYTGAMGPCQGLGATLRAAELLKTDPRFALVLVGDGVCLEDLQSQARETGLRNVHFVGRRPRCELPAWLCRADAVLLTLKSDPMSAVSIPSKTVDYLASGKPILAMIDGETADLVSGYGCGVAISPGDAGGLADAIRRLERRPVLRSRMGANSRNTYDRCFNPTVQMDRFIAEVEIAISGEQPPSAQRPTRAA